MNASAKLPVIAGASLAGLLISHQLAQAGIPHVLVGKKPNFEALRLGESLDFAGTWLIKENFGHLSQFFHRKDQIFALGTQGQVVNYKTDQFLAHPVPSMGFLRMGAGLRLRDFRLIHLDRQGFDRALYEATIASPYVERRDEEVQSVDYDPASDRVVSLKLCGGAQIEPSHIFDATFHRRLIAEAANISRLELGGPKYAVFTQRYLLKNDDREPTEDWEVATTVMNLGRGELIPGVEGQAWCIPFRSHVSIGLSIVYPEKPVDPDALIDLVLNAFASRGMLVADRFPRQAAVSSMRHSYYTHERAAGANWLLAGGACTQIHFFSSTGVTTALAAAEISSDFVKDPRSAHRYQTFLVGLAEGHQIFEEIEKRGQKGELDLPLVDNWVRSVFLRTWACLATSSVLRRRLVARFYRVLFASVVYPVFGRWTSRYYSVK